eukprot:EG_transcript_22551
MKAVISDLLVASRDDLQRQLMEAFPMGIPEKCRHLLEDVANAVLTPDEAVELACVYEEEILMESAAMEFLDSTCRRDSFSHWAPARPDVCPHILAGGYLPLAPAAQIATPPRSAPSPHATLVSQGSTANAPTSVLLAPHILALGYLPFGQAEQEPDSEHRIRISPHILQPGYLPL